MSQSPGKMSLMALAILVPFAVIIGIATSGRGVVDVATDGATSGRNAVDGQLDSSESGAARRRLQTSSDSNAATQLEMTICLTSDHTTDSATATAEQFKVAIVDFYSIENEDLVKVDDSVTRCTVDSWQRRISIYNQGSGEDTAADIAGQQVDKAYPGEKTTDFFTAVSESLTAQDSELVPVATDFAMDSLGFLVIWLDSSGDVVSSQASSQSKDVVNIGGTDVWWPWWAWLIYAAIVLCCICPMLFFFFKWRRDKEAQSEGFGGAGGKDMGTPAPPSATSSNPYGATYASGEEHKSGKN